MRTFGVGLLAIVTAVGQAAAQEPLTRIAFGSCMSQEKPQPFWEPILSQKPDLMLFLGDNIYGDSDNIDVLKAKYGQLAAQPGFKKLRAAVPVMATWDDHDYGVDDGGADFPIKAASQKLFCDFWNDPADAPRRSRPGVYEARTFGPPGKRVQVVMLDTRYFRSPLKRDPAAPTKKRYVPTDDAGTTLLGAAQWAWLGDRLKEPAEVRLLVSSIQVAAEDHGSERWMTFPHERAKLLDLIRDSKAEGVVVLSGDRHFAELSVMGGPELPYPLVDFTASGLNMAAVKWRTVEANRHRVCSMPVGNNFGVVLIDWAEPVARLTFQAREATGGEIAFQHTVPLSALKRGKPTPAAVVVTPTTPPAQVPPPMPKPDEPKPAAGAVTAADAAKKVGEKVVVEMFVGSVGTTRDKSRVFLNSAADRRDKDNLAVVLNLKPLAEQMKAKGITDAGTHFKGKKVRVSGTVSQFMDSPQIVVESLDAIQVVE